MADALCACCQIFGKPKARVNFVIIAGGPDSIVYQGIKRILQTNPEHNRLTQIINLTNYDSLVTNSDRIFDLGNSTSSADGTSTNSTKECCHGLLCFPCTVEDISNTTELDRFRKNIFDLLTEKEDGNLDEPKEKVKSASWILLCGSICLERALLDVFIQLKDQNGSPVSNIFVVLGLLMNEQQLFESWICRNVTLDDYTNHTYPEYEKRIQEFFRLLNSSPYLQEGTLLIEENRELTDDKVRRILAQLFQQNISPHRATIDERRTYMQGLLRPRRRTVRDIKGVRNSLQGLYQKDTKDHLQSLVDLLKRPDTADAAAAHRAVRLVLEEFPLINSEQKRAFNRQVLCGFRSSDAQNMNTLAAQLVLYTLRAIENYDDSTVPFLFTLALATGDLSRHFIFRHALFNHTPQIFTLSLSLISPRHYTLVIAGLRLCSKILDADRNEHKYAGLYLRHDPLTARKILDAIIWLLSPFKQLKQLWIEEEKKETDSESDDDERSSVHLATKHCFQHTGILLERVDLKSLASLFYGCFEHCLQVTKDDVHQIVETIDVLADPRLYTWSRRPNKARLSLLFVIDLCHFLMPILLNGSPPISLALTNETRLLMLIPRTILVLLRDGTCPMDTIDQGVRFYIRLIQSKAKHNTETDDDSEDEEETENSPSVTIRTEPIIPHHDSLCLTKDLLSSSYNLHRQYQKLILLNEMTAQQQQLQALFETEWKKIDTLQLKHDRDQLKQENQFLKEQMEDDRKERQRTKAERDQYRREVLRMAQEIERLKLVPSTHTVVQSGEVSTTASIKQNSNDRTRIIDQLQNLSPHQVTSEQAQQFIEEIYHRRTTFDDEDMRKSICGSLKHLGSDLYSSSVHFLHELIQNAEDNVYADTTVPFLRIELNHDYILFSNNEQGLRAPDVLAICSLAVSTKSSEQKHIGEKGVGFKSVFAATNQPMLFSHSWKFHFQVPAADAMSYITPLWVSDENIPQCIAHQISTNHQYTHLYLPLKLTPHTDLSKQFLSDIAKAVDPCILLNMRKLQKLEVVDQREKKVSIIEKRQLGPTKLQTQPTVIFEDFTYVDLIGSMVQLSTLEGNRTFRVYTCQIHIPSTIEQQQNPTTTLTLTFPCEDDYALTASVWNGLPVCDLGFNFLFNARFHLVTSRENVRENVPFNTYLRDHISTLFVYLLLNDADLRKDISRYCPSSKNHKIKHSPWWLSMIDRINQLITKHLSVLFDIRTGKGIRYISSELSSLVSNEHLYHYANIQVINSNDDFFTPDRRKSLHIQTVSMKDILNCFPDRHHPSNDFQRWTRMKDQHWWSQFFHRLAEDMTTEISDLILRKPLFLLQDSQFDQRHYLPEVNKDSSPFLLYIIDDPSDRIWKRQLTVLRYSSSEERTALLQSSHVQLLTENKLIELIQNDHLQLSLKSIITPVNNDLLEEIWKDLSYLQSRLDKIDRSKPLVVPIDESSCFTLIQNATLPTIFSRCIAPYIITTIVTTLIRLPYYEIDTNCLINHLQWEYFFLQMNCKRPSIHLTDNHSLSQLPLLPSLNTLFSNEQIAHLGNYILSVLPEDSLQTLGQFPIVAQVNSEEQIRPICTTFDRSIITTTDLPLLPQINVPSYCRTIAMQMGVCADYGLHTCVTILQYLGDEQITNIDFYVEWLGRLQLEIRQKSQIINNKDFLTKCQLYLPDEKEFSLFKNLLVMSEIPDQDRKGVLLVCKYLHFQLISPTTNQNYCQFKDLFRILGCQCKINLADIFRTIDAASDDKHNFYPLGDHLTTLKENGLETMIILYQYLENSLLQNVTNCRPDSDLYRAVVTNKHSTASCGSREDFQWRFNLTCQSIVSELRKLIDISDEVSLPLLTIDRQLIAKASSNIIYACFETKIIQNLSRVPGKRYFISPSITRICPLVLAVCRIAYVEQQGKLSWIHQNINLEYHLSQLTRIFQEATGDYQLDVVTSKYADVYLYISDVRILETIDETDDHVDQYRMESNYPYWIFDRTVLLCTGNVQDDSSRAIIAISALATLLHKRQHLPLDQAKLIARQKITACTEFRSFLTSTVASTTANEYSYLDVLFPTDHESIALMTISIGPHCTIEQDPEEIILAPERSALDELYRNRVEEQDHRRQQSRTSNNWINPIIVDGEEQIRIGHNAEHFFFTYLQKLYGTIDVTPTKNWRSSGRLVAYPQYIREIDDSAGYDFELHDTKEIFTRGTKSQTKRCYFEVKGTSELFHETYTTFHISQNELEKCQSIARDSNKKEEQAYFLVIIEFCLDPEKIALASMIEWSKQFNIVERKIDSYQCRLLSSAHQKNHDFEENVNTNDIHLQTTSSVSQRSESVYKSSALYSTQRQTQQQQQSRHHQGQQQRPSSQRKEVSTTSWQPREQPRLHSSTTSQEQQLYPSVPAQQQQTRESYTESRGRGRGRGRRPPNNTNASGLNWRK